jgi:PAS domain S-box-containing protein
MAPEQTGRMNRSVDSRSDLEFARKARISLAVDFITGQIRLIMSLRGLLPVFGSFNDSEFEETRFEQHLEANPSLSMATCWYWIRKLQARFFAGDFSGALAAAASAERLLWTSPSFLEVCEFHFYAALARAAQHGLVPSDEQPAHRQALLGHQKHVGIGAANCPDNFLNRAALIDAEIARLDGRDLDAMRLYEQSIQSARKHGFVQNEGVANELAANFYHSLGLETAAHAHLADARRCYLHWGALGKVRQLDRLHPHLREERDISFPGIDTTIGELDLATVVKMSQAVSGEIVLNRLIETLMTIAIEHAGAVRGLLLLPQGEELRIAAEANTSRDAVAVRLRQGPATPEELPESILRYVVRSQESVILGDSTTPNPFSNDGYIQGRRPRSVLCLPLVNQARLIGILYLENHLSSHVFTPARISVLQLLASQAAISLENARLYADLLHAEKRARKSESELQRAIDSIPALAWSADAAGTVEVFNKQWYDYTGLHSTQSVAGGWKASFHPEDLPKIIDKWTEILAAGESGEIEARMRRRDGEYRCFLVRATPLRDETGRIVRWYGTNTDIEDLKQAEALLAGEKRLLEMIARGESLPAILDALCRTVEELAGGSLASILLLDSDSKRLRHCAAPSLPASYTAAVDGSLISPSAGSCGTAAYRGEKVFVSDIAADPLWADYSALALAHGLRACWSTPIMASDGTVLGTFAIYSHEPRQITPRENAITEQFTHLASIVVERKHAENALKTSEAFLAEGQKISHTGSWSWDIATGRIVWSEEAYRIFGFDWTRSSGSSPTSPA